MTPNTDDPLYRVMYVPSWHADASPFESCVTYDGPGITWAEARAVWGGEGVDAPLAHQWSDGDHYVLVPA